MKLGGRMEVPQVWLKTRDCDTGENFAVQFRSRQVPRRCHSGVSRRNRKSLADQSRLRRQITRTAEVFSLHNSFVLRPKESPGFPIRLVTTEATRQKVKSQLQQRILFEHPRIGNFAKPRGTKGHTNVRRGAGPTK